MKLSPQADYPIRVVAEAAQWEGPTQRLFDGIYEVCLNYRVCVSFVPQVSAAAPSWDYLTVAEDLSAITTAEQARHASVMLGRYAVTPNESLAGTQERVAVPETANIPARTNVVWYVTSAEFDRYAAELAQLSEQTTHTRAPAGRLTQLRGLAVVRFLDERVAASPALRSADAKLLGKSPDERG